jgi:hypothetical protein
MRFIWVLLALLLSLPAFAKSDYESPPVITQALTEIAPRLENILAEFEPGDVAVFDLDNTVFREQQTLGTDEWYSHILHRLMQRGLSREIAAEVLEPVNRSIKAESKMRLLEPGLPQILRRLQDRGMFVIGLTARHPNLAQITLEQLAKLGVDFSLSQFPGHRVVGDHIGGLPNLFSWRGGVAFTDGALKGVVLKHILQGAGVQPKRIFAVDDRIHHIHNLVEAMLEMGIEGRAIHYLRVQQEEPFNPKLAELQYRVFKRLGRIISDEEAKSHLLPCERLLSAVE